MLSVAGLAQESGTLAAPKGLFSGTTGDICHWPSVSEVCSIKQNELPSHQFGISKNELVGIFILETQCLIGVLQSFFFLSPWTCNDHHQWSNKYVLHC